MTKLDLDLWLFKIENLQARLKWSISPSRIIKWLENFDAEDIVNAYDLILFLEFITFEELQARLDELLNYVIEEIEEHSKIIIVPYGKLGKSGPMLVYPLKNTVAYQKNEQRIILDWDSRNKSTPENSTVIFIDDFIGTGDTFIREYTKSPPGSHSLETWADRNKISQRYLLAVVTMFQAKAKIEQICPSIKIVSEFRTKAFDETHSVFNATKSAQRLLDFSSRYGNRIYSPPLGYKDSQALVVFSHSTPNNTLPIIWVDKPGWKPLYPRKCNIRIDEARGIKKEVAFYIGIMNRLGLDLYNHSTSIIGDDGRDIEYNHREDHSLLLYLKLKNENHHEIVISQVIGVTKGELKEIIRYGVSRNLLFNSGEVTPSGYDFFNKLTFKTRKHRFRSSKRKDFELKDILYLPKVFRGIA